MQSTLQQELLELLKSKALKRYDEPMQLASGEWSEWFIDGKRGLAEWADLKVACAAIVDAVHDAGITFDAVGGLTLGADALAVGIAAVADSRWFFVRKERKERGTRQWVEGFQAEPHHKVLLVDDVVTSGGSIIKAYDRVREDTGAVIVAAATLVDRSELARPALASRGVPYFPMATYAELGIPPVGRGSVGAAVVR